MADSTHSRSILLGVKSRKRNTQITVHRKTNQFKDFVKLLRESHARVSAKASEPEETKYSSALNFAFRSGSIVF